MADKNFKSYENFGRCTFRGVALIPPQPLDWDDTMKVFQCRGTSFERFDVTGGREDCVDVGRESNDCMLERFVVQPSGQYVLTCKGGSNGNHFFRWHLVGHGRDVDAEFGNWSTFNFERSTGNIIDLWTTSDGKPVTYCYRWGCRPQVINTNAKHLWWRSIGLTVYWNFKYLWHVILKQPDHMGK